MAKGKDAVRKSNVILSKYGFRFNLNSRGEYTVSSMRSFLVSKLIKYKGHPIFWSKLIPLKVRCFIWRASLGRIPMADALVTRGNKEKECSDHLLITCDYSKEVQEWILKWCGIQNRRFSNVREFIDYAAVWGNCHRKKGILSLVFYCLLWNIWLVRNAKSFNKIGAPQTRTADNIISPSYFWYKHRSNLGGVHFTFLSPCIVNFVPL